MRLAFTGTQKGMTAIQKANLRSLMEFWRVTLLVHGGCHGADDEADEIAVDMGIPREVFPSDMARLNIHHFLARSKTALTVHPAAPPLKRNKKIVDRGERLLACPHQPNEILRSGTWATVRYGRKALGEDNVRVLRP